MTPFPEPPPPAGQLSEAWAEKMARAIYETNPMQDQATDIDLRPTGAPFNIMWEQVIESGEDAAYRAIARAAWEASPAKVLIEALEVMIEAVENGGIDSPTMDGEPEVGIPPFKWHEEWLFHARRALSSLGGSET